jgi:hypothetical protein
MKVFSVAVDTNRGFYLLLSRYKIFRTVIKNITAFGAARKVSHSAVQLYPNLEIQIFVKFRNIKLHGNPFSGNHPDT